VTVWSSDAADTSLSEKANAVTEIALITSTVAPIMAILLKFFILNFSFFII
jgi:hypothetical protein